VHNIIFVNIIEWDTNHGENSENILFWKKLLWILFDNIFEALITLFHDNAWKIGLIFDYVNYLANHGVILQLQ
jgi:hypothetical protein